MSPVKNRMDVLRAYEQYETPLDHLRHLVVRLTYELDAADDHTEQNKIGGRAVRVLEAVAIAMQRRRAKDLYRLDQAASALLRDSKPDERFHGRAIVTRAEAAAELLRVAKLAIGAKKTRSKPSQSVYNKPAIVVQMMATTLHKLGLAPATHEKDASARLTEAIDDVVDLDDAAKLVRQALVAFRVVPDARAASDWLKALRARKLRAGSRRNK